MPSRRPLSVSSQVVLALLLGVVVGLFFGEHIAFLQSIGKAFILLLQMTVLPYIVLSLITSLRNLTYQRWTPWRYMSARYCSSRGAWPLSSSC